MKRCIQRFPEGVSRHRARAAHRLALFVLGLFWNVPGLFAQPSLTIGTVPGFPGANVPVPAQLRGVTNAVAAQFDLASIPVRATLGSFSLGDKLSNHLARTREIAPGVTRVVVYSPRNAVMAGTNRNLVTFPARLNSAEFVSSGPLTPGNAYVAKADGTKVSPLRLGSGAIFASSVNRREDGIIDFFLPSQADQRYLIQATTDFVLWVNLTNTIASGDFMSLVDVDGPSYAQRFYRSARVDALGEIAAVALQPGGTLTLQISGQAGRQFTLQTSTNLAEWTDLSTVTPTAGGLSVDRPIEPGTRARFFRLRSSP